jgi:hypothetical protein
MAASRADRAIRFAARALPREFRERVFEPALADLRINENGAPSNGLERLFLMLECLRIGLPQHVWRRGRPTRLGLTLACALLLVGFVAVRLHYAAEWRADEMRTHGAGASQNPIARTR